MQDLADRLGLSKSTVCRALQNHPKVSRETVKAVLNTASELGYRRDPALSALVKHRWSGVRSHAGTYAIAMVTLNRQENASLPYGDRLEGVDAFKKRANELNIITDTFHFPMLENPEIVSRQLQSRGFDGIVLNVSRPMEEWDFSFEDFSIVLLGHDHPTHRLHSVTSDWRVAVDIAVEQSLAAGRKRIGLAPYLHGHPKLDEQIQGAVLYARECLVKALGPQPTIYHYGYDDPTPMIHKKRFLSWFKKEKPDIVIDGNGLLRHYIREMGRSIPEDAGYCSLLHPGTQADPFSGVRQRYDAQAIWALERVLQLVQQNKRGFASEPTVTLIEPTWVDQGTV